MDENSETQLAQHFIKRAKIRWVQLDDLEAIREKEAMFQFFLATAFLAIGAAITGWVAVWSIPDPPVRLIVISWLALCLGGIMVIATAYTGVKATAARRRLRSWDDFTRIPPAFSVEAKEELPTSREAGTTEQIFRQDG